MSTHPRLAVVAAAVICLGAAVSPAQSTWHVQGSGSPGGLGTSLAPFGSIQQAIGFAANGDEILVRPGTYLETIDLLGKRLIVRAVSGPTVTTINGNSVSDVVSFRNGETRSTVLHGFRVTGGRRGLRIDLGSSPTVMSCVIAGNVGADTGAGGLVTGTSSPLFISCTFSGNRSGEPFSPIGAIAGRGGALAVFDNSVAEALRCRFTANRAGGQPANEVSKGGGIYVGYTGVLRLRSSVVADNVAEASGLSSSIGGGIAAEGGSVEILDSQISGNSATNGGGASVWANLFAQCLIANNTAVVGAGLDLRVGPGSLTWCTITDNHVGPAVSVASTATLDILNTILHGNAQGLVTQSPLTTVSASCIQGGFPGPGNIAVDPAFVNPSVGNYHLSGASPCRDAGFASFGVALLADFDGEPRTVDSSPDMGVDEFLDPAAAHSITVGSGCNAPGLPPLTLLSNVLPNLGRTDFRLEISNIPQGGAAFLCLADRVGVVAEPLAGGCPLLIDLLDGGTYVGAAMAPIGPLFATPAGTYSIPIPIPNDPAISGADIALQAAATSNALLPSLFVSNALYLRFH